MKKILFVLAVMAMGHFVNAQDATTTAPAENGARKHGKLRPGAAAAMKELNLNDEQKTKVKAIKEANKAQKDAIKDDASLTEAQKKEKLKAIHKEEAQKVNEVLNDEQRTKLKQIKERRKHARHTGDRAITRADETGAPAKPQR